MSHYGHGDPRILLLVAVGWVCWQIYQRVQEKRAPGPVEKIHERYRAGEIDETELERRLDFELDERNQRIVSEVESVGGVGPITAKEIALSFDSVDEIRRADRSDLEKVPNVGPERAEQISDRF